MTEWQMDFARKVETIREASRDRFERVAEQTLTPTFKEFQEFATQQGLQTTAPLSERGVRTFNFTLKENAYALLMFHLDGLEHCKFQGEFRVPNHESLTSASEWFVLEDINVHETRRVFEHTLDRFLDTYVNALGRKHEANEDPVGPERKSNRKSMDLELQESVLRG